MNHAVAAAITTAPANNDDGPPSSPRDQSPPQPQQRPAQRRASVRSRRDSEFSNSLESLPENVPVDALLERPDSTGTGGSGHNNAPKRSSLDSLSSGGSEGSGGSAPVPPVAAANSTCNAYGRRPARRSSRYKNVVHNNSNNSFDPLDRPGIHDSITSGGEAHATTDELVCGASGGDAKPKRRGSTRQSWKMTDWDEMPGYGDSFNSSCSLNASQASLYHKLDELLEERGNEEWEDKDVGNNSYHSNNSGNRRSLHDMLFEELGNEGNGQNQDKKDVDVGESDRSSLTKQSSGHSAAPRRRVSRQTSAKSFRRSIHETLKQDEDSPAVFGTSSGTILSSTASESELGHSFGGLLLDDSDR